MVAGAPPELSPRHTPGREIDGDLATPATVLPTDQRTRHAAHTDDTAPGWEGGPRVERAHKGEETHGAPTGRRN